MFRSVLLAYTALALYSGAALGADMVRIKSEAEFRNVIVGKKLGFKVGHQIFHADGTITGMYKGYEMAGTWIWAGDTYCRTLGLVGRTPQNDCRTVAVKDNKAKITRNNGKGDPYVVTIGEDAKQ